MRSKAAASEDIFLTCEKEHRWTHPSLYVDLLHEEVHNIGNGSSHVTLRQNAIHVARMAGKENGNC